MVVLFLNVFAPVNDGIEGFRMSSTDQNYRPCIFESIRLKVENVENIEDRSIFASGQHVETSPCMAVQQVSVA